MNENKNKRKLGERSRGFDFWWCGESGFIFPLHVFICFEIKFELNPLVFFKLKWVKWPWYKFPLPSTFHSPFWTPRNTIRYEDLSTRHFFPLQLPIWRSSKSWSPSPAPISDLQRTSLVMPSTYNLLLSPTSTWCDGDVVVGKSLI